MARLTQVLKLFQRKIKLWNLLLSHHVCKSFGWRMQSHSVRVGIRLISVVQRWQWVCGMLKLWRSLELLHAWQSQGFERGVMEGLRLISRPLLSIPCLPVLWFQNKGHPLDRPVPRAFLRLPLSIRTHRNCSGGPWWGQTSPPPEVRHARFTSWSCDAYSCTRVLPSKEPPQVRLGLKVNFVKDRSKTKTSEATFCVPYLTVFSLGGRWNPWNTLRDSQMSDMEMLWTMK